MIWDGFFDQVYFEYWTTEATTERQIRTSRNTCLQATAAIQIEIQPCNDNEKSQKWRIVGNHKDISVEIHNLFYQEAGNNYCLALPSSGEGPLSLSPCGQDESTRIGQRWVLSDAGQGGFRIIAPLSPVASLCASADQTILQSRSCNLSEEQLFAFRHEHLEVPTLAGRDDGRWGQGELAALRALPVTQVLRTSDGRCLSRNESRASVEVGRCSMDAEDQMWRILRDAGKSSVVIGNRSASACLTAAPSMISPCLNDQVHSWELVNTSETTGTWIRAEGTQQCLIFTPDSEEVRQGPCSDPTNSGFWFGYRPNSAIRNDVYPWQLHRLWGTTFSERPELGGTVLQDEVIPFVITDRQGKLVFSGNVQNRVATAYGGNRLDFSNRLFGGSDLGSGFQLVRVIVNGFTGCLTEADYRVDGLGSIGPTDVRRSGSGGSMIFSFDRVQLAQQESLFFFTIADATDFSKAGTIFIEAENPVTGEIAVVPLPHTFAPAERACPELR